MFSSIRVASFDKESAFLSIRAQILFENKVVYDLVMELL